MLSAPLLSRTKKSASLANVKNTSDLNNIKDFPSEKQRSEYIANFYKKIYTRIDSNNVSIEDFLGQEISNSNYVKNKKLTDDEKNSFDLPLDVFELDNAIKKTNMNSAPGIDGWSYRGASFFWDIFRIPLTYAFNFMISNKDLKYSFSSVLVKLIPKKDDITHLKNWRPISLLSVFYKIPSSAYSNRLKRVNGIKLFHRDKRPTLLKKFCKKL